MVWEIFFPKNGNFSQNTVTYADKIGHHIGFQEKHHFCRTFVKIAEKSDHNIDPSMTPKIDSRTASAPAWAAGSTTRDRAAPAEGVAVT
jgi:hypothetical protein